MTSARSVPMKYAHLERERRFLITDTSKVPASDQVVHITDHYITGTRLRLRVVDDPSADTIRKLGQKIRFDDSDPTSLAHTSLYLTEQEYEVLASLPASTLSKARDAGAGGARTCCCYRPLRWGTRRACPRRDRCRVQWLIPTIACVGRTRSQQPRSIHRSGAITAECCATSNSHGRPGHRPWDLGFGVTVGDHIGGRREQVGPGTRLAGSGRRWRICHSRCVAG